MRESDLLREIYARNCLLPSIVTIPPGDDMAALTVGGETLLAAVDQVIEGRHVRVDEDPALIGRKAVARNVSDVAAMAARPLATLASVVLPARYGSGRAKSLYEGVRATADVMGCPLIGGDTAMHADAAHPLVMSVTILATPAWPGARVVTRRGGRLGDGVYVTGRLGGSLEPGGGGRHLSFTPRVDEAIELLRSLGTNLRAMLDLSDGLGKDAARLTEGTELAVEIDSARVPTYPGLTWQRALGDGEDYELLFTSPVAPPSAVLGTPVTRIGTLVPRDGGMTVRVLAEGRAIDGADFGWEHVDE